MTDTGPRRGVSWRVIGWGFAAVLLAMPAVAMRFTEEVNWTGGDFVFAAVVFGLVGLGIELTVRASRSWAYRGAAALAVLSAFMIVWANAAVGMIGSEDSSYNLWFLGLVPLAIVGAVMARARARGLALVMLIVGSGQVLAAAGGYAVDPRGSVVSMVLAGGWFLSALLFHMAGREGHRG